MPPIIALLTDFGLRDAYVGIMKGVALRVCSGAQLVDISHEVPAQDVVHAAHVLRNAVVWYPSATIFVAVVDPGVGTERRAIAIHAGGSFLIGPDNGLLEPAARALCGDVYRWEARDISQSDLALPRISNTFHGRDIFAPVAAHLAAGTPFAELGPRVDDIAALPFPRARRRDQEVTGAVVHVDRFGNLVTNIPGAWIPPSTPLRAVIAGSTLVVSALAGSYVAVPSSSVTRVDATPSHAEARLLLITGSTGQLEIARAMGSAADYLEVQRGQAIVIDWEPAATGEQRGL